MKVKVKFMSKHMSLNDRQLIQFALNKHSSFKEIGRELNRDCTTIRNEILNNREKLTTGFNKMGYNNCLHRKKCNLTVKCPNCINKSNRKCSQCGNCRNICEFFEEEVCEVLNKPPYVCNGCQKKYRCSLTRYVYDASAAQKLYEERLSNSRKGINLDEGDLEYLNKILKTLVKDQGQSIHHVLITHKDELIVSERTLYEYIDLGYFPDVRNIDLPRKVRYRGRSKSTKYYKVDKNCLEGRKYEDYLKFKEEHPNLCVVEMDSVEGKKGESCILTLHFVNSEFMIAFKREYNNAQSVIEIFDAIYDMVGLETFKKLFPIILTDNGTEFSDPKAIEFDSNGNRRTWLFYCHPSSPQEKGACEVNHELIRRIVPKGISWDNYEQKDINLMMSHVNSYARENLNDKSPHLLFTTLYSNELANLFGISRIEPDNIVLKPTLLSK